jgi:hypothetical protein
LYIASQIDYQVSTPLYFPNGTNFTKKVQFSIFFKINLNSIIMNPTILTILKSILVTRAQLGATIKDIKGKEDELKQ